MTSTDEKPAFPEVVQNGFEFKDARTKYPMTKFQIWRNLIVVSFGFLLLFTAFQSLSNLQSTLNKDDRLGVGGLSIIYGALVISCMFLPTFVIGHVGCKWTIAFAILCYILYMVANFYAVWGTIAPAAVILGIGAAPLWSAKCTYLTQMATWYSKMTGATEDDVVNRFFGVFFMIFQTSQIWGNLISSTVFSLRNENSTVDTSPESMAKCGANFDPQLETNNTNLNRPELEKVYIVCGIYVGFAVLAFVFIAVCLQKITLDQPKKKEDGKISFDLLLHTFKHWWKSDYQKLIMILTIYSGIEQAFAGGAFTKSFISCSIGIWNVGYVMICYGVVDAVCSLTFGRLVQFIGHIPFFVLAFLLHGGAQVTMLLWTPDPDRVYIFYILAGVWGMGDAVIQTQINALYGYLFTGSPEAAFANYRLWESIGFIIAFAYNDFLVTRTKLFICMAFLSVGMLGYACVEVADRNRKSKEKAASTRL